MKHYRILKYGNSGYRAEWSRDWVVFGKKYRGFWHDLMTGCMYAQLEDVREIIAKEVGRDMDRKLGWRVVSE